MREIKFKAWDSKNNKMFSAEEMGADELQLNPDGRGFFNASATSTRLSQYYPHLLPLQFTGLKDASGEDIYEGDILDLHPGQNDKLWHRKIIWDTGAFHCIQIHGTANHPLHFNKYIDDREWIVIGNMYQNPELL